MLGRGSGSRDSKSEASTLRALPIRPVTANSRSLPRPSGLSLAFQPLPFSRRKLIVPFGFVSVTASTSASGMSRKDLSIQDFASMSMSKSSSKRTTSVDLARLTKVPETASRMSLMPLPASRPMTSSAWTIPIPVLLQTIVVPCFSPSPKEARALVLAPVSISVDSVILILSILSRIRLWISEVITSMPSKGTCCPAITHLSSFLMKARTSNFASLPARLSFCLSVSMSMSVSVSMSDLGRLMTMVPTFFGVKPAKSVGSCETST